VTLEPVVEDCKSDSEYSDGSVPWEWYVDTEGVRLLLKEDGASEERTEGANALRSVIRPSSGSATAARVFR
jgi:hypothetical protein